MPPCPGCFCCRGALLCYARQRLCLVVPGVRLPRFVLGGACRDSCWSRNPRLVTDEPVDAFGAGGQQAGV